MVQRKNLKFKAALAGRNMTITALSKVTAIGYASLASKINGERNFKLSEIKTIREAMGLTQEEVISIFLEGPA